jgi:hypothetical protein
VMWHLTKKEVQTLADQDWACRTCHRQIGRGAAHAVLGRDVKCGEGLVFVRYRYHAACAPTAAILIKAVA